MIEGDRVDKSLGGKLVLDGVCARIEPGRVLGLIGPNGAGKSTLLSVLAADARPDRGTLMIDGTIAASLSARELARRRALLPQTLELVFDFSVRDLVLLGRTPHADTETAACRKIADRCLKLVGLEGHADRTARALSGGERQRAHIARVLAQIGLGETGRYLLLDEPVSNQDPSWQLRLLDEIRALSRRDVGVAIVLHDLNLAARICDELLLMQGGAVVRSGTPAHVLDADTLGEVFDVDASVDADPWVPGAPRVSFRRRDGHGADVDAKSLAPGAPARLG